MTGSPAPPPSKILTLDQADAWVQSTKAAGLRLGFTCGAFDLLHAGHVQYLAAARERCDRLMVAVNSDASVRRYKHPLRPIHPEAERMYVVAGLASVDAVVLLDEDRPLNLLLRWKPGFYIKGGDYGSASLRSGEAVRAYGGQAVTIPVEFGSSTTSAIERIQLLSLHAEPEPAAPSHTRGLVLLDRDGTLIRDIPFLHDPKQVELLPGVADALLSLQSAGFRLAIVSNQQGIGLGYYRMQDFIAVNQALFRMLGPYGIRISKVYFCPHSMADSCGCRKPAPGMVLRAMRDFGVTPEQTFLIGDNAADVEAARSAGASGFLVGDLRRVAATIIDEE